MQTDKMDTNRVDSPSANLFQQAIDVLPGGVSRNTIYRRPHPYYASKAAGCYVTDIEGIKRLDFANNMASLIHGHAHPAIIAAVTKQLQSGTAFTLATEAELRYAQLLCARVVGFDKIRFVNSGTEAVMALIKAARAYTGKTKIAKVEGAYHGSYDYAEVSQTATPDNWGELDNPTSVPVASGTPETVLNEVVVIPFNDPQLALKILDRHSGKLAGILIDPLPHRVCLSPATAEFVEQLYHWTRRNNALLLFDEVIAFRNGYGGAQEDYSVKPDLTALGKIIGGGFPAGAFAGCREVMEVFDPSVAKMLLPHSGTFSANPITMTAGRVALEMFDQEAVTNLNKLADQARQELNNVIKIVDIPACVSGAGSMFRLHLKEKVPQNYREAYLDKEGASLIKKLVDYLYQEGIIMINTCSGTLSTSMTKTEIDQLATAMLHSLKKIKPLL
jgi:glutamate-1-semialdehyde 2,1-aminomutase